MDFRTLEYLLVLADEQSFSKAAQRLYISQSSLSHTVLKLEGQLGVSLFDRKRKPLTPTLAGEKYLDTARKIIRLRDGIESDMKSIDNEFHATLRIGISSFRVLSIIPDILQEFVDKYPYVNINMHDISSQEIELGIMDKQLDIGILSKLDHSKIDPSSLSYSHLMTERILLACPPMHPYAPSIDKIDFDLSLILKEPFILYKRGFRMREISDYIFESKNVRPNVILETASTASILRFSAAGLGFGFVSQYVAEFNAKMKPAPLFAQINSDLFSSSIVICRNKQQKMLWCEEEFIKILHKYFYNL